MLDCWQLIESLIQETLCGEPLTEAYVGVILKRLDRWTGASSTELSVASLPFLTCQAVGGAIDRAVPVGAAWQMLHIAAKLFDDVEDGDADDPTADINIATAVLAVVPLLLETLGSRGVALPQIQRLTSAVQRAVALASAGQHADLLASRADPAEVDPARWLSIAQAKSGALLAWAAWAGALAGGASEATLKHCSSYGKHLGVLLQIADDFIDIWRPEHASDLLTRRLSLPVCYALSVVSVEERATLRGLLDQAAEQAGDSLAQARRRLIELGAQEYSAVTARVFQQHALAALQAIDPANEATQQLATLVEDLVPRLELLKLT